MLQKRKSKKPAILGRPRLPEGAAKAHVLRARLEHGAGDEQPPTEPTAAAEAANEPIGTIPRPPFQTTFQTSTTAKMLAQYQIPLGANQAQLIFTGEELTPEDFDALADYVGIFKKQFVRKQAMQVTDKEADATPT